VNCPDDFLRVIDINIPEYGKAQEAHGLLPVYEDDYP